MSDIEPIWESEYILNFLSEDRLQNQKESSYLLQYKSILSQYYNAKTKFELDFCEKELAKLENTETIRRIVEREGPDDLILEMTFAKTTLNRTEETTPKQKKKMFERLLDLLR